ncbi:PaaX family transcriptional regulator C-terminal domain-containing protein [Glutamicibacter sp. PS]|uniref:PaaX family transcriptional regulator n=1 Tax=Glutamicibacter sp. PS TaxID=3075634 RepID=UPI00284FC635|nr:PaaX family transcriptional regulator C-terminal domain-containing protein [Glutamicibacter sp. PS]MDR4533780.1 regulator [Glutamicibacter sp. PS]
MESRKPLAAFALDDFEVRIGSATSLLRTIGGLYLRHHPAPVARATVLELLSATNVSVGTAQTAITRLSERGLLAATGTASKIEVTEAARAMFARGDRRIFTPRQMTDADSWLLLSFSVPESQRAARHQLRRHLLNLGGGLVNAGLWIFPEYLHGEVSEVLEALELRNNATLFIGQNPQYPISAQQSAESWWNLTDLAARHQQFIANAEDLPVSGVPREDYASFVRLIDSWRAIPYLDPGLPPQMLPAGWPGTESRLLFMECMQKLRPGADDFAHSVLPAMD